MRRGRRRTTKHHSPMPSGGRAIGWLVTGSVSRGLERARACCRCGWASRSATHASKPLQRSARNDARADCSSRAAMHVRTTPLPRILPERRPRSLLARPAPPNPEPRIRDDAVRESQVQEVVDHPSVRGSRTTDPPECPNGHRRMAHDRPHDVSREQVGRATLPTSLVPQLNHAPVGGQRSFDAAAGRFRSSASVPRCIRLNRALGVPRKRRVSTADGVGRC